MSRVRVEVRVRMCRRGQKKMKVAASSCDNVKKTTTATTADEQTTHHLKKSLLYRLYSTTTSSSVHCGLWSTPLIGCGAEYIQHLSILTARLHKIRETCDKRIECHKCDVTCDKYTNTKTNSVAWRYSFLITGTENI